MLRKINSIISASLIILIAIHAAFGALAMTKAITGGALWVNIMTDIMLVLLGCHIIIGTALTIIMIRANVKSGTSQFKNNALFWIRRLSGFAIIAFAVCHILIFSTHSSEHIRLNFFGGGQLALSICLVLSLVIHICTNIRPLSIALGAGGFMRFVRDAMVVIGILLLACAVGFIIYFIRWNAI